MEYVSIVISIFGVVGTFYYGIKFHKLGKRFHRFEWSDINLGIKAIGKSYVKSFQADFMLSVSGPGAIVANLLMTETQKYIPLFLGISEKINEECFSIDLSKSKQILTSKWKTYIPAIVFNYKDKRVIICDDCVLSGDLLEKIKGLLLENGFKNENIITMALFASDIAIDANKGPDVYWYKVQGTEFYMPWGKSIGRTY